MFLEGGPGGDGQGEGHQAALEEIRILKEATGVRGIVALQDCFQVLDHVCLVFELLHGGDEA